MTGLVILVTINVLVVTVAIVFAKLNDTENKE